MDNPEASIGKLVSIYNEDLDEYYKGKIDDYYPGRGFRKLYIIPNYDD